MNCHWMGFNGFVTFMPQNSQAKTDDYPAYVFTYVAPTPPPTNVQDVIFFGSTV